MKVKKVTVRQKITGETESYENCYAWKWTDRVFAYIAVSDKPKGEPTIGNFSTSFWDVKIEK